LFGVIEWSGLSGWVYLVWVWSSNNDVNAALSDSKLWAASNGNLQSCIRLVIMIKNSFF